MTRVFSDITGRVEMGVACYWWAFVRVVPRTPSPWKCSLIESICKEVSIVISKLNCKSREIFKGVFFVCLLLKHRLALNFEL